MSCTSPLYRIPIDSSNYTLLYDSDRSRVKNGGVFLKYPLLQTYRKILGWREDDVQVLPCGQCTSCRLNYSRNWAIRCSLEAAEHEHNYFVTLTYDNFSSLKVSSLILPEMCMILICAGVIFNFLLSLCANGNVRRITIPV